MKLMKKLLSLALCLAMLVSSAVITFPAAAAAGTTPATGAFIFSDENARACLKDEHGVELTYNESEESMRFLVTSMDTAEMNDPYVYLDLTDLNLNTSTYKYAQITYKCPEEVVTDTGVAQLWGIAGPLTNNNLNDSLMAFVSRGIMPVSEFYASKSNNYMTATVDLTSIANWSSSNKIQGFRFDPANRFDYGDVFYLDSIILANTVEDAENAGAARLATKANTGEDTEKYKAHPEGYMLVLNAATDIDREINRPSFQFKAERTPRGVAMTIAMDIAFVSSDATLTLRNQTMADEIFYNPSTGELNVINARYNYKWGSYGENAWRHVELTLSQGSYNAAITLVIDGQTVCLNEWGQATGPKAIEQEDEAEKIFGWHWPTIDAMIFYFTGVIYIDNVVFDKSQDENNPMKIYEDFNSVRHYQQYFWHGTRALVGESYANPAPLQTESGAEFRGWKMSSDDTTLDFNHEELPGGGVFDLDFDLNFCEQEYGAETPYFEFRAAPGAKPIRIAADGVTLNGQFTAYDWGAPEYQTWHHIWIHFDHGTQLTGLTLYIDGVAVASCATGYQVVSGSHYYFDKGTGYSVQLDNFYLDALAAKNWGEHYDFDELAYLERFSGDGERTKLLLGPCPKSIAEPKGAGWTWPVEEAYGYCKGTTQGNFEATISFDLCLLPSTEPSIAVLYTNGTNKAIAISQYEISVGIKRAPFYWGEIAVDNWHRIKIVFKDASAAVYVDNTMVISGYGMKVNDTMQLLFSYRGEMYVDNYTIRGGTPERRLYLSDFEDEGTAKAGWGEGLGHWTQLNTCTVKYDVNGGSAMEIANGFKVAGKDMKITDARPEKAGFTFLGWNTDKNATAPTYRMGDAYKVDAAATLYAIYVDDNHEHSYGAWTQKVAPTCTEDGVEASTCSCGAEMTRPIPAKGHTAGTKTETTVADCFVPAYDIVYCAVCDGIYSKTAKGAALGHAYSIDNVAATATTHGAAVYSCSRCGYTFEVDTTEPTTAVAVHGNAVVNSAKTELTVTLNIGNNPGLNAIGLTLGYNTDALKIKSLTNGTVFSSGNNASMTAGKLTANPVKMLFDENAIGNITANGSLATFVFEILDINTPFGLDLKVMPKNTFAANGANFKAVTVSEVYIDGLLTANTSLITCEHPSTELSGKKDAKCLEKGYTGDIICSVCHVVVTPGTEIDALGHDWGASQVFTPATCSQEGLMRATCKRCSLTDDVVIEKLPHTPVEDKAVAVTCTTDGLTAGSHCSVCTAVIVAQTVIPKTGHTPVEDPAVKAECTTAGKTAGSHCATCKAVLVAQETIPALGHNFVEGYCTRCGKIQRGPHTPGDVNDDTFVDSRDLTALMKYLAGYPDHVNEDCLDITNDGLVNAKDMNRLMKFFAGAEVEIY